MATGLDNFLKFLGLKEESETQKLEALKHSKIYSELLKIYVTSVKENIVMKKQFKIIFFITTIGILIIIVVLFILSFIFVFNNIRKFSNLNDITIEAILGMITILLPSITSLIVAFIKIPEIIAQYLFNTNEDNYMDSIIKSIQNHDISMVSMEYETDDIIDNNKCKSGNEQDDIADDSPKEEIS